MPLFALLYVSPDVSHNEFKTFFLCDPFKFNRQVTYHLVYLNYAPFYSSQDFIRIHKLLKKKNVRTYFIATCPQQEIIITFLILYLA